MLLCYFMLYYAAKCVSSFVGANAAWALGKWDDMGEFINPTHDNDRNDVELHNKSSFYEAVYCIKLEKFTEAKTLIDATRKRLAYAVSTLLSENYSRAYRGIVSLQILSELEEVIEFKRAVAIHAHATQTTATGDSNNNINNTISNMNASVHGTNPINARKQMTKSIFKNSNEINLLPPSLTSYNSNFSSSGNGNGGGGGGGLGTSLSSSSSSSSSMNRFNIQMAKENLLSKWRARLKWIPKETDVYRQILVRRLCMNAELLNDIALDVLIDALTALTAYYFQRRICQMFVSYYIV